MCIKYFLLTKIPNFTLDVIILKIANQTITKRQSKIGITGSMAKTKNNIMVDACKDLVGRSVAI